MDGGEGAPAMASEGMDDDGANATRIVATACVPNREVICRNAS